MKSSSIMKFMALAGLSLALLVLLALVPGAKPRTASATANPLPPLISCPNLDGSDGNDVKVSDILAVIKHFGKDYGQAGYGYLWDPVSPYNSTSPAGTGQIRVNDILFVVQAFNDICPVVDTQIAKATRAIGDPLFSDILCDPALTTAMNCGGDAQFLTEDATFLATRGYFQGSGDVSGQGVHYVNKALWDGVFNPARPEGLVYDNGLLAAQLYVVRGDGTGGVGWGSYSAGPCTYNPDPPFQATSCPGAIHGIDLESDGPSCSPACSWDGGYDGWHLHYYLCTVHIGHTVAAAIPGSYAPQVGDTQGDCQTYAAGSGSGTECPVPMTSGDVPCYTWGQNVGWMGHLWSWLPNANLIPDNPASNGRFADCYPDGTTWGPFNCPG